MTPERFAYLADAYGADLQRWPSAERAQAQALLDTGHATARQALQQARWLDTRLDSYRVPEPSPALVRQIIATAALHPPAPTLWQRYAGWLTSLGWIGVGLSGAAAGMLAVTLSLPLPPSAEALPSVLDQSDAEFVLSINAEEAEQ
ncbi:hypothetical protein NJH78_05705 [Pseudomonas chlororaphis]|uniref:hypothetical protein n=1 Tax=Pseudomonas chlororaphis group TaxID=136842 RepID=UPI00209B2CA3|nr:hypothetical protein [Pseudomonas chlororaphis]MCO7569463.1 hypothetical protein [Pseudomonas chlororaphis]MCO7586692.1 hypothetical protein [Pseudomonas chlororaphis]